MSIEETKESACPKHTTGGGPCYCDTNPSSLREDIEVLNEVFHNGLSLAEAERLALLVEELGEAIQVIGKIQRHGYESRWPPEGEGQGPTNRELLEKELGDVEHAMLLLTSSGDLDNDAIYNNTVKKIEAVKPYLHHQPE